MHGETNIKILYTVRQNEKEYINIATGGLHTTSSNS
jgi:hypothetical protein